VEVHDLAADHKLPWAKGGTTTEDNLQMLCAVCNGQKTSKYIRDMQGEVINLWRKTHTLVCGMKATFLLLDIYIE
jgi:5-methylcytosine-specific restriction endonuclease McrA